MTLFPTFFGCYEPVEVPLVLYAADAPWSAYTNETFLMPGYTYEELDFSMNKREGYLGYLY